MALFSGKKNEAETADSPIESQPRPSQAEIPSDSRGAQQEDVTVANIGKSIAIKGDLTGNEDMVIEGSVEGSIDLPNNQLTIGANGVIKAEIHAKSVIVIGHVVGNINGIERVEIQGTGRVEGNVGAPKFVVAEGAQLDGSIQMTGAAADSSGSNNPSKPSKPLSAPATEAESSTDPVRKAG